jgi:hypothetical protein
LAIRKNWTQASERLKGALQNVGIEMILKAGRMDAEYSARIMGSVNPMEVKHVVEDEQAEERSHPAYSSLPEQWERQIQDIQRLRIGEAFVRLADDSIHKVRTRTLPHVEASAARLAHIRRTYLERYFVPDSSACSGSRDIYVSGVACYYEVTRPPDMSRLGVRKWRLVLPVNFRNHSWKQRDLLTVGFSQPSFLKIGLIGRCISRPLPHPQLCPIALIGSRVIVDVQLNCRPHGREYRTTLLGLPFPYANLKPARIF